MRSPPNLHPRSRRPMRAPFRSQRLLAPGRERPAATARSTRRGRVHGGAAGVLAAVALLAAAGASAGAAAEPVGVQLGTAISLDTSQAPLDGDWVVVAASGGATWRPQGDTRWQPIMVGRVLPAPSEIETGATGDVTLVLGGDRLVVAPSSRLILMARGLGEDQRLRQERGRLHVDIEHRPGRAVEVRTPLLSLGIKGTSFEVAVDPWQSSILVLDGRVTVSPANGGPPVELGPRQGLSQPADVSQPARRLQFSDLPPTFSRDAPVRWHLPAPAAPAATQAEAASASTSPAVQAVEDQVAGGAPGSMIGRGAARPPAPRRDGRPEKQGWLGTWPDDQPLPLSLILVAAAGLLFLIVPALILGQNLRQQWLDRSADKDKRRRSLISDW